jgi:hypothetical protein
MLVRLHESVISRLLKHSSELGHAGKKLHFVPNSVPASLRYGGLNLHEVDGADQVGFQVFALDYGVKKPFFY